MTKQLTYGGIFLYVQQSSAKAGGYPVTASPYIDFRIEPQDEECKSKNILPLTLSDAIEVYKALGEKIEELQSLGVEV